MADESARLICSSRRTILKFAAAFGLGGVLLTAERDLPQVGAQEGGAMVKLSYCLRRLPHLSREEFQKYWFETHGPLVRKHADVLRVRRYLQFHSLDEAASAGIRASRGGPEQFDGIAELWWDSVEDFAPANPSAERNRAGAELLEDERKFIDLANSPVWLGQERVIIG